MFHWLSVRLEVHAALEMILGFVVCDSEASIGDTHRCLFESPNVLSLIQFKVVMKWDGESPRKNRLAPSPP